MTPDVARDASQDSSIVTPDTAKDTTRGGQWMTYGELARMRGIDRQSAVKLVRRQQWRRQPGNHGEVLVFVPQDSLSRPATRALAQDETRDETPGVTRPVALDNTAFETALAAIDLAHASEVAALRERADAIELSRAIVQGLVDRLEVQLAEVTSRADRAEAAIAGERQRAERSRKDAR